jgi:small-conductance mechanosensitive channel
VKSKKNTGKWNLTVRTISILIGAMLGLSLVYIIQNEANLNVLLGALTAALVLIGINVIKVKKKKDVVPDSDERTVRNVLTYFLISTHLLLGLSFLALGIISLMGVEFVPVVSLWIIIIVYLLLSGIGAFIVSRR